MKTKITLAIILSMLMTLTITATTRYVRPIPTSSAWSTQTSVYDSLTVALREAVSGDEIWVAAGTYNGHFSMKDGVNVYGGFIGTETVVSARNPLSNKTILNGNFLTTNTVRVLSQPAPFVTRTTWDGFIIQNGMNGGVSIGQNASLRNCIIRNNRTVSATGSGGGIMVYVISATPAVPFSADNRAQIINCVIHNNTGTKWGGGVNIGTNVFIALSHSTICNNLNIVAGSGTGGFTVSYGTAGAYDYKNTDLIVWGNMGWTSTSAVAAQLSGTPLTSAVQGMTATGITTLDAANNGVPNGAKYPKFKNPSTVYGAALANVDSLSTILNSDWSLLSSSACVNTTGATATSTDYVFPSTDIAMNPRISWGSIDLGAYEFQYQRPAGALTYYIKPYGGSQWADKADPYLQSDLSTVLNLAQSGDEIWVASGTYTSPTGGFIMKDGVNVLGGFNGTETNSGSRKPLSNKTILDGNFANKVLKQPAAFAVRTRWDGFIMQNGKFAGAGVSIGQNGTLENCIIRNNKSTNNGGGVSVDLLSGTAYDLLIDATNNRAWIINCAIHNNTAQQFGGGVFVGASASAILLNATLTNNRVLSASGQGGISQGTGAAVSYINSILWGNIISSGYSQTATSAGSFLNSAVQDMVGAGVQLDANNTGAIGAYFVLPTSFAGAAVLYADSLNSVFNSDWQIQSSSACIDKGSSASAIITFPTTDLLGNKRQFGTKVDQGAFEFGSSPSAIQTVEDIMSKPMYWNIDKKALMIRSEIPATVSVFNIVGKMVKVFSVNGTSAIDMESLNDGIYIAKWTANKEVYTLKFVK